MKKIFDLAFHHYQNGNLNQAEILFKKVLKSIPKHFSSIFLLGTLSAQDKKFQTAKKLLEQAIEINPNYAEAHNNLGNVFQELGRHKEAIVSYQSAININPNILTAYHSLANSFRILGKYQEAITFYQKVIEKDPNYIEAHNNLGNVFQALYKYREAIFCYQKAIQINSDYFKAYFNLGIVFNKINKHQEAIKCFKQVIQKEPKNLSSHWLSVNTFPVIYKNFEEICLYTKSFEKNMCKINQLLDENINYSKEQVIEALESTTNFHLHYQGKNVLRLQKKYAKLIERLTKYTYPQFQNKRKKNRASKYIKIGFISAFFRNHSVSKSRKNWILKLDQKKFKTYIYYTENSFDQITDLIKNHVDYFVNNTDIDQLVNQIYEDSLDVLFYLDIGMNPMMQILASLRLAPVQCNTWGHPVTSGLKNIDYFFSSQLMEKKCSQKHYSEKLINLPGIGIDYNHAVLNNIKKPNVLNKYNKTVFINLQSLFKLLPQDDHIYLEIFKKLPNSCFWFLQGRDDSITSAFKERISKFFQKKGISFEKHSYFHPRCEQNEFFGLIEQSDIVLDSIHWSGCNSSLEAISLNKPIVTLPSAFMRGRHTYSFLKVLNIKETIANTKKEYVRIAVKLAIDNNFKNSVINKIKKNKNKLFNDEESTRFLEGFFKKTI